MGTIGSLSILDAHTHFYISFLYPLIPSMPHARRGRRGRRGGKRSLAKMVRQIVNRNQEMKRSIISFNGNALPQGISFFGSFGGVLQGLDLDDRIGNQIRMAGIRLNLRMWPTLGSTQLRVLVLKPKALGATTAAQMIPLFDGPPDLDYVVVKYDRTFVFNNAGDYQSIHQLNFSKRWTSQSGPVLQFAGPAATDVISGFWQMFIYAQNIPTGPYNQANFSGYMETFFYDA